MSKLLKIGLCSDDVYTPLQTSEVKNEGFTYNDGQGVQQTIVMDGPLSQIYSKALNIYLAKKPIEPEVHDSLSAAFESAAIDTLLSESLNDEQQDNEVDAKLNGYKIVSANSDVVNSPDAIVYSVDANNSNIEKELSTIETNSERYSNIGTDFIVFIAPEFGVNGKMVEKSLWVDFSDIKKLTAKTISNTFKTSTEQFFESRGIKAVVGFENLLEWLKTRSKA